MVEDTTVIFGVEVDNVVIWTIYLKVLPNDTPIDSHP